MIRRIAVTALALSSLAAVGCADTPSTSQVFGASSTRVINDQLSDMAGELDPPQELSFNNHGSGSLVTQLNEGADADVLITADTSSMEQAVANGTVHDPHELATNTMVMVVPPGNPAGIHSLADLNPATNLVLCDPQVPCGKVSSQLQELNDVQLQPVSLEGAVGDVLGKVTNAEADAGWVYRSDAQAAGADVEVVEIPHAGDVPNTLWVAAASNRPEACALVDLILSDKMAVVLEDAGFTRAS